MFDFDNDGDFDFEDLIQADISYGLFEEDDKIIYKKRVQSTKVKQKKEKSFFDFFKF